MLGTPPKPFTARRCRRAAPVWAACWRCWNRRTCPRRRLLPTRAHTPLPTCWLQCGQLLASHLDPLLERAVPHHLPLHLAPRGNPAEVIPSSHPLPAPHLPPP